jgi:hypothetical protein
VFAAPYLGSAQTTKRTPCCLATDTRYCCQVFLPTHCLAIGAARTPLLRDAMFTDCLATVVARLACCVMSQLMGKGVYQALRNDRSGGPWCHLRDHRVHVTPTSCWSIHVTIWCITYPLSMKKFAHMRAHAYVCACTHFSVHKNIILMLDDCNISRLTRSSGYHLSVCQHSPSALIYNPPQTNCFSMSAGHA